MVYENQQLLSKRVQMARWPEEMSTTIGVRSILFRMTLTLLASAVVIHPAPASDWFQLGGDIDGEAADDLSGTSVAVSADGRCVAIGATFNGGNGDLSGHLRVYAASLAPIMPRITFVALTPSTIDLRWTDCGRGNGYAIESSASQWISRSPRFKRQRKGCATRTMRLMSLVFENASTGASPPQPRF